MTAENPLGARYFAEKSTAGLVNRASSQMSTLVGDEIALARTELARRQRRRPNAPANAAPDVETVKTAVRGGR